MPTVATIDGIKIQFYWDEHPPLHFHAEYAEYQAQIAMDDLQISKATYLRRSIERSWRRPSRENPSYGRHG